MSKEIEENHLEELTRAFIKEATTVCLKSDVPSNNLMNVVTTVLASMTAMSAALGKIPEHENYSLEQRIVFMGNQAVVCAFDSLKESGQLDAVKGMCDLRDALESIGDEDDEPTKH